MSRKGMPCEVWTRSIGPAKFRSVLTRRDKHAMMERFGVFEFELGAQMNKQRELVLPVTKMYCCGIRIPVFVQSESREFEDEHGRYAFDVKLTCFGQLLVHYKGYLHD